MVKPSDMLSRKSVKNASSKDGPQLSRLGTLLSKHDKAQKILMSKKRKSIKQLDKSNSLLRSRENLETEEGLTMVNQPLISAEVQSFSDRLSLRHDSNPNNKSQNKPHRFNQKSLLEMASRTVKLIPKKKSSFIVTADSATDKVSNA